MRRNKEENLGNKNNLSSAHLYGTIKKERNEVGVGVKMSD